MAEWVFRGRVLEEDRRGVREVVASTGFFSAAEIDVAEELVDERLRKGEASGYLFVFAEDAAGRVMGYSCYGPVPCTLRSFDLYWIAVRDEARGLGLGRAVLAEVEARLRASGGGKLIAETSSRDQYAPTRAFYLACGFTEEARIRDYYAPGEDVLYFTKTLG
jgi:ribosomal protein S18 acetylase RimI-like enzyme